MLHNPPPPPPPPTHQRRWLGVGHVGEGTHLGMKQLRHWHGWYIIRHNLDLTFGIMLPLEIGEPTGSWFVGPCTIGIQAFCVCVYWEAQGITSRRAKAL